MPLRSKRTRAAYAAQVQAMDAANKATLETIPVEDRKLVTATTRSRTSRRTTALRSSVSSSRMSARSRRPADLAALVETVKAAGVKAIFSEAQFSPELAQALADEAGITNVVTTLYNDTVGPPPADTYLKMMRMERQGDREGAQLSRIGPGLRGR